MPGWLVNLIAAAKAKKPKKPKKPKKKDNPPVVRDVLRRRRRIH